MKLKEKTKSHEWKNMLFTVGFTSKQYRFIKQMAEAKNTSMSAVIRDSVDRVMYQTEKYILEDDNETEE